MSEKNSATINKPLELLVQGYSEASYAQVRNHNNKAEKERVEAIERRIKEGTATTYELLCNGYERTERQHMKDEKKTEAFKLEGDEKAKGFDAINGDVISEDVASK